VHGLCAPAGREVQVIRRGSLRKGDNGAQAAPVGRVATLPPPAYPLPRHKPPPAPRAPTRWEAFAAKKGIQKKKRPTAVWDEDAGEWRRRHGYKRAGDAKDVPIIEASAADQARACCCGRRLGPRGRGCRREKGAEGWDYAGETKRMVFALTSKAGATAQYRVWWGSMVGSRAGQGALPPGFCGWSACRQDLCSDNHMQAGCLTGQCGQRR